MTEAREGHFTVRLSDGTVLMMGGLEHVARGVDPKIAEIYDPSTGQFRSTGSMQSIAHPNLAILLSDGTVLVYGQTQEWHSNSGPQRTFSLQYPLSFAVEIYDPNSRSFAPAQNMIHDRLAPRATLLNDGRVLFSGGDFGTLYEPGLDGTTEVELYDPKDRSFSRSASMREPRISHSATLLEDGTVLIAGGRNVRGMLSTAEIYDPVTGRFHPTGSMSEPRLGHNAFRLSDGRVLLIGGTTEGGGSLLTTELYEPKTGTFVRSGRLYAPGVGSYGRYEIVSQREVLLPNGSIWLMEVANVGGNFTIKRATYVEIYDLTTGHSRRLEEQPTPREWGNAILLESGSVLISGGEDPNNTNLLSSAEVYVP